MTWVKGEDRIRDLVTQGRLQRVPASREAAEGLVRAAQRHLASAELIVDSDPQGAYALAYDGARKGMAAVLEVQGLRATSLGGHVVLFDALEAQFEPPLGHLLRPFNRMRVRRNQVEYASTESPAMTPAEVRADLTKAHRLIDDFVTVVIEQVFGG